MKEKSEFEKRTAEKQVSLLTEALTSAVDAIPPTRRKRQRISFLIMFFLVYEPAPCCGL